MPYIANLENGRGNPTTGALARLASALGTELHISFGEPPSAPPPLPQSLVRLRRTERFRRAVDSLGADPAQVIAALAAVGQVVGRVVEASEQDWWRVLDAMVLVARHPAG